MTARDYRDSVIEHQGDELAALTASLETARADVATWTLIAKIAIHQLAAVTTDNDRLRRRLYEQLDLKRDVRQEAAA